MKRRFLATSPLSALWVVSCVLYVGGCSSEPGDPSVRVDLKTDYAPFVEFDAVRIQVGDSDLAFRADHVVALGEDYLRGQRIDETTVQSGEHPITVTLFSLSLIHI